MKNGAESDLNRLLKAMDDFGNENFKPIDREEFDDPEVADAFNRMLDKHVKRNNHYLARINEAQLKIADSSCLKAMLEQIAALQDVAKSIQDSRTGIESGDLSLRNSNGEFMALAYQIRDSYEPCLVQMRQTEKILESIDIPGEDSAQMKRNPEFWAAIAKLKKYVSQINIRMESIGRRMDSMLSDAEIIFDESDKKMLLSKKFMGSVDRLTDGYRNLSAECLDTGRHLYKISRDVDNARNDMFRHNSAPTMHDDLCVFETDHVTLTWRLYNNMVEFESLRLTQLNNPTECKFGRWVSEMTDERITGSEAFKNAVEAHFELHKLAVECFEAKMEYKMSLAKQRFEEAMMALKRFRNALNDLHSYFNSIGITERTDILKYKEQE